MAKSFVQQLTLEEKCNMISDIRGPCVANILPIPRLNLTSFCFQDTPCGVGDGVLHSTTFAAGIHTAATCDRDLFYQRAVAIGKELQGKGIHVALAPMMNMD
jgi:beta-glucosidase